MLQFVGDSLWNAHRLIERRQNVERFDKTKSLMLLSLRGTLSLAWLGQKKPRQVARTVHGAQDVNAWGQRLIKDEVVVKAAHTPAPHTREPGVVKILGASHAGPRGQRGKGVFGRL